MSEERTSSFTLFDRKLISGTTCFVRSCDFECHFPSDYIQTASSGANRDHIRSVRVVYDPWPWCGERERISPSDLRIQLARLKFLW